MSIYIPDGTTWHGHHRKVEAALEGIGFLTEHDVIALMGGDVHLCSDRDRAMARGDLRALGYRERPLALWGRRPIFWRWEKVTFSPQELAARWGS